MDTKSQSSIEIMLLAQKTELIFPKDYPLKGLVRHIKPQDCEIPFPSSYAYGSLSGIHDVLEHATSDYICVSADGLLPALDEPLIQNLLTGEIEAILPRVYTRAQLQESYRSQYYGYDFRMLLSILKKEYPDYYRHAKEEVLDGQELIMPGGVFCLAAFRRIWTWMFSVLQRCAQFIPKRVSAYQNRFLEHLAPYLFTIYVTYWKEHHPYELREVVKLSARTEESCREEPSAQPDALSPPEKDASPEAILSWLENRIGFGKIEEAVLFSLSLPEERQDTRKIRAIFEQYERERRYEKLTALDKAKDWKQLLSPPNKPISPGVYKGRPRLLIFQWNSVGHKANVRAFESFGFECHTIKIPYNRGKFDEDCLEQLNRHLDLNHFDLAFSLNCIGMVAEACYVHDIPYIAWCYDSPSFTGAHWYLKYPTTHVFLFDSSDAEHYRRAGIEQAHYMPLAVNLEYFGKIPCTEADHVKYGADISFIGSLYDTSLPQAMGYLTDYQKGYLNALMDNQLDVYGHSFFPEILSQPFMEWLDHPEFNRLLNAEFDKEKATEDIPAVGRLQLILNKQTTNKERLLLLNLLAKHHQVKLYSYKNSEALLRLTFCGTADYYTEMPRIFRCSRINLNATLRSIQHGIPLRCLDIMGCHGLLLTNYQKDFDDHFKDGENVLFYTDAQEALEKADFYLAHDALRERIAEAGYETVKRYYDYPVKLQEIFETAGLEHLIPKHPNTGGGK